MFSILHLSWFFGEHSSSLVYVKFESLRFRFPDLPVHCYSNCRPVSTRSIHVLAICRISFTETRSELFLQSVMGA